MKRFFCLSLLVLLFVLPGCTKKEKPAVEGNPAPAFTLKDLDGREVKLADLKGKVVIVNFWATWCPPCREEIPSMMQLNQAMAGKPFQMLAISINEGGAQEVQAYFKQSGNSLPALLDPTQQVAKRYGVTGVPESFVIDRNGVILKKVVGGVNWSDPAAIKFMTDAAMK
ncbi:MAG TPA: TlpA disulfide reductase family protein [Geobacteraceae bacterium]|nr:TlpA disulfide reductase family protein [Geobacteraceae bacterium]